MAHQAQKDPRLQDCIERCLECEQACTSTVPHCLAMGGRHTEQSHIVLLLDCARICATGAEFMMRSSRHHARICAVCAELCDACAQDCETFRDDETMRRCAETCRRCAESCRQMAGADVR